MKCPTCGRREPRSPAQNSRYWKLLSVLSQKTVSGVRYSSEVWHEFFKRMFLGADDVRLPNGKVISISKSTTDLDKLEFNDYMTQTEAWINERGVFLEE